VARLLRLSDEAAEKWQNANVARWGWKHELTDPSQSSEADKALNNAIENWQVGCELYDEMGFEAAQLDLIARHPLRDAAAGLVKAHAAVVMISHPERERSDWHGVLTRQLDKIAGLRQDLLQRARADLGADYGPKHRLRSLWRRLRARRKLARLRAAYPAFIIEPRKHHGFAAVERATGKTVVLAKTIESLEGLLLDRQVAHERGEQPPGLVQEI
jgi:hypothetical protein